MLVLSGQVNTWELGWEMGLQMPEMEREAKLVSSLRPPKEQLPSLHGLEDS